MTSRIFLIPTIIFSFLSSNVYALTNIEKSFADLERVMGGCQADLQAKNTLIGKATSELKRLDGLVTALKSDLEQKDKQNEQLREQVTSSDAKIVNLQGISNDAKACGDKNAKATQNLTAAVAANSAMKNQLELSTSKNQELIAQNKVLKQQLLDSNSEMTRLKSAPATKSSNSAETENLLAIEKNKNQQLSQKVTQLEQQLLSSNNQPAKLKATLVAAEVKPLEAAQVLSIAKSKNAATKTELVSISNSAVKISESSGSFHFEYLGCKYSTNSATCEMRITNEENDASLSIHGKTRVILSNGEVLGMSTAKIANSSYSDYHKRVTHLTIKNIPVLAEMTFKGITGEDNRIFGIDVFAGAHKKAVNVSFRNLL